MHKLYHSKECRVLSTRFCQAEVDRGIGFQQGFETADDVRPAECHHFRGLDGALELVVNYDQTGAEIERFKPERYS